MLSVIGVGFGRTGTASMKLALERLGFGPCYHMMTIVEQPERADAWQAVADGEVPDWETMFAGFVSTVDWPAAAYWRELCRAYPDAKVLLTVRDGQRWYDSMDRTIFAAARRARRLRQGWRGAVVRLIEPGFHRFIGMTDAVVVRGVFGGDIDDRELAVGVFERHIAEVRAEVPAERLLVFDVAEGWQPLCDFLGVVPPAEPFPHVNDAVEFARQRLGQLSRLALRVGTVAGVAAGVTVAGVVAGRKLLRRR